MPLPDSVTRIAPAPQAVSRVTQHQQDVASQDVGPPSVEPGSGLSSKPIGALLDQWSKALQGDTERHHNESIRYKTWSWVSRALALVFFGLGVLLPLYSGPFKEIDTVRLGYACLIFAGLWALTDQVFVHAESWIWHAEAEVELAAFGEQLDLLRLKASLLAPNDAAGRTALIAEMTVLARDKHRVIEAEHTAWSKQLRSAMAALRERIRTEEAQAAGSAGVRGAVRVILEGPVAEAEVTCAGNQRTVRQGEHSIVFGDLPHGLTAVAVKAKLLSGMTTSDEKATQVSPGLVADLQFSFGDEAS